MATTFYILRARQIKARGLEQGSRPGDTGGVQGCGEGGEEGRVQTQQDLTVAALTRQMRRALPRLSLGYPPLPTPVALSTPERSGSVMPVGASVAQDVL